MSATANNPSPAGDWRPTSRSGRSGRNVSREACACRHDAAPDAAIAAVRSHKGPVLIDLDGTLYFGNSTEDFIDTARPGLLALLMLRALDLFRPWRWTGGEATRDVWRVRLVAILFPWTSRRWNARVKELARNFTNGTLVGSSVPFGAMSG